MHLQPLSPQYDSTPLHAANGVAVAKLLIEAEADIQAKDEVRGYACAFVVR
jgi:hypothetical protein